MGLRVLVIGTGFGVSVHVPALRRIDSVGEVLLARGRGGRPSDVPSDVRPISDWLKAVRQGEADAVIVAVPPFAQISIAAALSGHSIPTLVEKPGGTDPAALEALPTVVVGYNFRFTRGLMQLIEAVAAGAVGPVRHAAVEWLTSGWAAARPPASWRIDPRAGGGVLRDVACHSLDYLQLICGTPERDVDAQFLATRPADGAAEDASAVTPHHVRMSLRTRSGAALELDVTNVAPTATGHAVRITGEQGVIEWSHAAPFRLGTERLTMRVVGSAARDLPLPPDPLDLPDSRIPSVQRMLEAFLAQAGGAQGRMPAPASAHEAAAVLRVIEAAEQSAARNTEVSAQS